jgi:hypothetical protein
MKISVTLKCHRSSDWPCVRIWVDNHCYVDTKTQKPVQTFEFDAALPAGSHTMVIEHWDKKDSDTWCDEHGKITADRALEIDALCVDGYSVPRNIIFTRNFYPDWPSHFENPPASITNNNWLGFNGRWIFDFESPFDQTYFGYFWQMEYDANVKYQKTDAETKQDYFEAYGLKIKVDENFEYTLTDLKRMIEANEPSA